MMASRQVGTARRVFPIHFAVVAALTAVFALLAASSAPEDGANIGAGLVGLPLLGLGLPWSIPAILIPDAFGDWGKTARVAVAIGPAWVNVALHAAAVAVAPHGLTRKALRRLLWMALLVVAVVMIASSVGAETTVQRLLSGAGAFFAVLAAACARALAR